MIIQTDIKAIDETGKEGYIAAKSPKELLSIMQQENIEQCKITVSWLGQEVAESRSITIADVRQWILENEKT